MAADLVRYMDSWLDEHLATLDQAKATSGLDLAMRFSEDVRAAGFSDDDVVAAFGILPVFMGTKLDEVRRSLKFRPIQGHA